MKILKKKKNKEKFQRQSLHREIHTKDPGKGDQCVNLIMDCYAIDITRYNCN